MISNYLKKISIINYKNIVDKEYNLDPKINCFVGNNGVGKTNILDSIYHLALGKSYFNLRNDQLINIFIFTQDICRIFIIITLD